MKKLVSFIAISLFLISFAFALSITSSAVDNSTGITTNTLNKTQAGLTTNDNSESEDNLASITSITKNTDTESAREKIKNAIEARNKAIEALKEKAEKTTINAEITGTQTKVEIKEIFYTTSTNKDDIIAEIIAKFALDKDTAKNLLKIEENNEEGETENNVGENEQEEQLQIKVNVNNKFTMVGIKMEFVLNTTDKEEILNAIVDKSKLTADEINSAMKMKDLNEIIKARNKLDFEDRTAVPCPSSCTCTGSSIKCTLADGREMTILAGKSGNVIVQVKGENMTTNVTLYKATDGKLYGVFKNNETKEIKALPDQVKERIKEKLSKQLENENVSLDENGSYKYTAEKKARLFAFIPVTVMVRAEIDPETGDIIKISKNPWWAFLARDESQTIVGASCGTVTPGSNDACCKTKGFDVWNSVTNQCEFSQ